MAYRKARYVRIFFWIIACGGCFWKAEFCICAVFSQAKKPSLSHAGKPIYLQAPPQLEQATRPNLTKKVSQLVPAGNEIVVTSSTLPFSLNLQISYAWCNLRPFESPYWSTVRDYITHCITRFPFFRPPRFCKFGLRMIPHTVNYSILGSSLTLSLVALITSRDEFFAAFDDRLSSTTASYIDI